MTRQKSIPAKCPTSNCLSEVFPASRSVLRGSGVDSRTQEELCSITLPELSKPKDLQLFSLKTYPVCYRTVRGKLTKQFLKRFQNWGIYDSVKDIKYRKIPNEISVAVALTMVLDFNVQNLLGLSAAAVFFITALFTGKIGGGDVKLIIALSVVCGLWGTVFLLFSAQLSMLVFYAVYAVIMKIKGRTAEKSLPFVPFITLGYLFLILLKLIF